MNNKGYSVILDSFSFKPSMRDSKGVLNKVTFSVNSGEFVTLIGRNGHGKTSIIKAIAGELDSDFISGTVKVGQGIIKDSIHKHASGVGVVHQFVQQDLVEKLSILKNIQIRQLFSNDKSQRKKAIDENWKANLNEDLSLFIKEQDFAPSLDTLVENLSGGQRQLLNVLISLKFEHSDAGCQLLLLDEHLTSLDVVIQEKVMLLIEAITKSDGIRNTTIIMVTHDFEYALRYSDRILVIKNGEMTQEFKKNETSTWAIEKLRDAIGD